MLRWLTELLAPPLEAPSATERLEAEQVKQESRRTAARVNRVVDAWHRCLAVDIASAEVEARARALAPPERPDA